MNGTFWITLSISVLAALVTTLGIWTIWRFNEWGQRNATYFASLAAGILITVSFLHIIPEALEMNAGAPTWLLTGFLGLYLLNRLATIFVCELNAHEGGYAFGVVPMIGIGFHSFIDGLIYSVAFTANTFTGVMAALGMVLHEVPEGAVTYLLLMRGGFERRRAALWAFLAVAATTPAGTLVSYPLISRVDESTLGAMLAVSAGALVYVGATHLLPHVEHEGRPLSMLAMLGGVLIALIIVISKHGL
jgi:ZIP family zinc transporter